MKNIMKYILVCGIALPFVADTAVAEDEITLKKSVIGSGGMVAVSNESGETLSGVMGQTAIGKRDPESLVEGKLWTLYQGFWSPDGPETSIEDDVVITNSGLKNYPNPMTTTTTIEYQMPGYGDVLINIYDMNGKKIRSFDLGQASGTVSQTWDATDNSGADVASGSYLCEVVVRPVGASNFEAQSVRTVMVVAK